MLHPGGPWSSIIKGVLLVCLLSLSVLYYRKILEQSHCKNKTEEESLWGGFTFSASPIQLWTKQLSVLMFPFQSAAQNWQAISVRDVMLFPCFPGRKFQCRSLDSADNFLSVSKELETNLEFVEQ